MVQPPGDLIGRVREVDLTHRFVEEAGNGPEALVIAGVAGIGKTAIWQWGVDCARALGHTVLTARPAEDEMLTALLGLSDLIDGSDLTADILTPSHPRQTRGWLEGVATSPSAQSAGDAVQRGRRMLEAIRSIAVRTPVVVAIDDLQWLDADSGRALRYVFRRIEQEPIRLLATWRTGVSEPPPDPLSMDHRLVDRLNIGPLPPGQLRRLLARQWGSVSPLTLRSIHAVSGGNPLYAIEVARSLSPDEQRLGIRADAALPKSLNGAIERRLDGIGERLRTILELIAVAGPMPLTTVEEQIGAAWVGAALREAQQQGVLDVGPDMRIHFSHPLLASGVLSTMNPVELRRLHGHLSQTETDPSLRARHMALATDQPDEQIAAELEARSNDAQANGMPAQAAEFARHSRRLTPGDDPDARWRRLLLEARGLGAAGDASGACALFDQLIAELPPGPLRAESLIQRFYVENDSIETGDGLLVEALNAATDDELRGRILDLIGWHRGVFRGDLIAGLEASDEAVRILEGTGNRELLMWALGHRGHMRALAGSPEPDVMQRSIDYFGKRGGRDMGGGPAAWLSKQQLWAGAVSQALDRLHAVIANYTERGFTIGLPWRYYDLSLTQLASGDLVAAHATALDGTDLARDVDSSDVEGWLRYPLALACAWLGRLDDALRGAEQLADHPGRLEGSALADIRARSVKGIAHLSTGDAAGAIDELLPAVTAAQAVGFAHPGAIPILPNAVMAAAWLGDADLAARLLEDLDRQADRIEAPKVFAQAIEARGVLVGTEKDPDEGVALLERAHEVYAAMGLAPDAARASLGRGKILLRAGRRNLAADVLAEARDRFEAMSAAGWARHAAAELDRANPRRSDGGLTDQEERIAALVSTGSTNKEIAATLFVSVATVEAHLTRLYRKLQIKRRTELSRMVLDGTLVLSDPDGDASGES